MKINVNIDSAYLMVDGSLVEIGYCFDKDEDSNQYTIIENEDYRVIINTRDSVFPIMRNTLILSAGKPDRARSTHWKYIFNYDKMAFEEFEGSQIQKFKIMCHEKSVEEAIAFFENRDNN